MISDCVQSVDVSGSLYIRVGEHGGKAAQDVAEQDHTPHHAQGRDPLLLSRDGNNVSIPVGSHMQN